MSLDLNQPDFDTNQPITDKDIGGDDFTPIPKGRYLMKLVNVKDIEPTKNTGNTGKEFTLEIQATEHKGRKVKTACWDKWGGKEKSLHNFFKARFGVILRQADGTWARNPNIADWNDCVGTSVLADIVHGEFVNDAGQKQQKNEIKTFGLYPLTDATARAGVVVPEGFVWPVAVEEHKAAPAAPAAATPSTNGSGSSKELAGTGAGAGGKRDDYSDL